MLHLVDPEEVDTHWDIIKVGTKDKLGPLVWASEDQIRQALKDELLFCFAILEQKKEQPLRGFAVCSISGDPLSDTKSLIVLSAYAALEIDPETWADALVEVMKFAKQRGCSRAMGFTKSQAVTDAAEALGINVDYRLLSVNL